MVCDDDTMLCPPQPIWFTFIGRHSGVWPWCQWHGILHGEMLADAAVDVCAVERKSMLS